MTSVATGIHDHPDYKLGKGPKKVDPITLQMAEYVDRTVQIPPSFDFDAGRSPFKSHMWGNNAYGDCVIAARSNNFVRLERVETKRTPGLTDDMAIATYKALTGCQSPGDNNDTGLVMLDALKDWNHGWNLKFGKINRDYTIDAYGEIKPSNSWLLRAAIYLFNGIQFGFAMPISAQSQTSQGFWDVSTGPDAAPGSWGGHAVYAKRFDADNIYVVTWDREVRVTNAFINTYADEAWTVIDSLDNWRSTHGVLDVQKLLDYFKQVGIKQAV